jgi:hypothetical protein
MFDPKRAARVGAKQLRHRFEGRIAKKSLSDAYYDEHDTFFDDEEREGDHEDYKRDSSFNFNFRLNSKVNNR